MNKEIYQIIDNSGVIYSGDYDFVMEAWYELTGGDYDQELLEIAGDLRLVKIISIYNG
jgi:hypothetical protein